MIECDLKVNHSIICPKVQIRNQLKKLHQPAYLVFCCSNIKISETVMPTHKTCLGENAFTCWAFSCASMLRVACLQLVESCFRLRLISQATRIRCEDYIRQEGVHVEIRNLIMMILLPKKLHMDDQTQGAYLRAAVSRVSR